MKATVKDLESLCNRFAKNIVVRSACAGHIRAIVQVAFELLPEIIISKQEERDNLNFSLQTVHHALLVWTSHGKYTFNSNELYVIKDIFCLNWKPGGSKAPARSFSFLKDDNLRDQCSRDYESLHVLFKTEQWKSYVLIAGSISEAVLHDILIRLRKKAETCYKKLYPTRKMKDIEKNSWILSDCVNVAHGLNILRSETKDCAHVVREFRNLIHPLFEKRKSIIVEEAETTATSGFLEMVLKDVYNYIEANKI